RADVQIEKAADRTTVTRDELVTFTIVVRNNGPDSATDVVVSDPLPAGMTYVANPPPSQGAYDPATEMWAVGTLPNGATATLQVVARITHVGSFVNEALVSDAQLDPVLSNNHSAVPVVVLFPPDEVSKRLFLASTVTGQDDLPALE